MTSMISEEEVEDWLWHIAKPTVTAAEMKRGLGYINQYAITVAHKLNPPVPVDPYGYLKAGEFDEKKGVGRCDRCRLVRRTGYFWVDRERGRQTRCRDCPKKQSTETRKDGYLCRGCNTRKPLDSFPDEKRVRPAMMVNCLACG